MKAKGRRANSAFREQRLAVQIAVGLLVLTGFAYFLGAYAGFVINISPSVPVGLWRIVDVDPGIDRGRRVAARPNRQAVVAVCPPDLASLRGLRDAGPLAGTRCPHGYALLLKPLAATGGDIVDIRASGVVVNGHPLPASARRLRLPSSVTSLVDQGEQRVEAGTIWLIATHPDSYDSRYFGPLPASAIVGVASPIWIW